MQAANFKIKKHHSMLTFSVFKLWMLFSMMVSSALHQQASFVEGAADGNISPCELETLINQLLNPSPEYQLHASALRNQLKRLLRDRQLTTDETDPLQTLSDYAELTDEDKRSVAALAAQGLLNPKRSVATLAKNGQLPTPEPDEATESATRNFDKRYVGALARSGGFMGYGKRNVGTLARDFQLPQNGKRNLATLARLGLLKNEPKRNVAAVARYNSMRMGNSAEKRNLGALKGSPVHGNQQKRDDDDVVLPAVDWDFNEYNIPSYYMYPSYADLDWGDFGRAQKRFLDTSRDPELFGIQYGGLATTDLENNNDDDDDADDANENDLTIAEPPLSAAAAAIRQQQQKRHIGAVYRSGFLPSFRALRSTTGTGYGGGFGGGNGGRFSRSGRARQFV